MTERQFQKRLERIRKKKKEYEQKCILDAEKQYKTTHSRITTTKSIVLYLFVIFNILLIYCCAVIWHFGDTSPLPALITDIAAQVLVFMIYAFKSSKENTKGGVVYDVAMQASTIKEAINEIEFSDKHSYEN